MVPLPLPLSRSAPAVIITVGFPVFVSQSCFADADAIRIALKGTNWSTKIGICMRPNFPFAHRTGLLPRRWRRWWWVGGVCVVVSAGVFIPFPIWPDQWLWMDNLIKIIMPRFGALLSAVRRHRCVTLCVVAASVCLCVAEGYYLLTIIYRCLSLNIRHSQTHFALIYGVNLFRKFIAIKWKCIFWLNEWHILCWATRRSTMRIDIYFKWKIEFSEQFLGRGGVSKLIVNVPPQKYREFEIIWWHTEMVSAFCSSQIPLTILKSTSQALSCCIYKQLSV